MSRPRAFTGVVACVLLSGTGIAHADAVTDWNAITIQTIAIGVPPHPGATATLDGAMVQAAVYDAVVAIEGGSRPYAVQIPGAHGSPAAAVAKAAHDVLVNRFPSPPLIASLDATYHTYLFDHGLAEDDPGVAVGQQAAAGIIALRANDGSFPANFPDFVGGNNPGDWRPTTSYLPGPPPSGAAMLAPWLGAVTPFTLKSPSQFRAQGPPKMKSKEYADNYDEVKAMGAHDNSARTPDQTDLALFWAANYQALWNRLLRDLAAAHVHNIADSARLFALVNLALADSAITAWDSKLHFNFWRPVTAIQLGDTDGNSRTVADPNWKPLINTPNYPDYTSGANNGTGAVTRALALFFGTDEMSFTVHTTNPAALQQARTFDRFSDAAAEVVVARIYEGIHFRFADVDARAQGRAVAKWAFKRFFRPTDEGDHDDDDDDDDGGGQHRP
jgi:PAP2 superfamily